MRVLISAFGCSPYRGSECAVGWNIPFALAAHHEVTVICGDLKSERPNWKGLTDYGLDNIPFKVEYVPPTRFISALERLHRLPGMWALYYWAYNLWQRRAFRRAKALHSEKPFEIIHQLNMIGYREPGYMWKLDAPFVWGPIGGAPNEPWAFRRLFSLSGCVKVGLRTLLNEAQKRICWRARHAAKRAKKLWAVTAADETMIRGIWGRECERMVETGAVPREEGRIHSFQSNKTLRLVWSGIHTSRKALPILLEALATPALKSKLGRIHLDVLGAGPETSGWKSLAQKLGVDSCIEWHGMLKRDEGLDIMRAGHIFVCTSIKEASSIVVMEAISLGLPVICHDACGMGVEVTETCGVKVPLRDPETSIAGFAEALWRFIENPELVETLSHGALARAQELTWSAKAAAISRGYEQAVNPRINTNRNAYEN